MDQSYSKTAFDADVASRQNLQTQLAHEIAQRIHEVVAKEFEEIGQELKKLGHLTDITSSYDPEFASWAYIAEAKKDRGDKLSLRFHYDSQVSCFYD